MAINMSSQPKERLDGIILLRVFATLLVVIGHALRDASAPNPHMFEPHITSTIEVFIKKFIYSFHMPLFFWVSGYLFYLSIEKKGGSLGLFTTLVNKLQRVVVPLYATAFLLLLPTMIYFGQLKVTISEQIELMLYVEQSDHLWFLKVLFLIFLILTPLARLLYRTHSSMILLGALVVFAIHLKVDFHAIEWLKEHIYLRANLILIFKFLPYFLIGIYTRRLFGSNEVKFHPLVMVALVAIHAVLFVVIYSGGLWQNVYLKYLTALFGIYGFYLFALWVSSEGRLSKVWGTILTLDGSSYSIYLFHVSILYIILFSFHFWGLESGIARIALVIVLGTLLPMVVERFLRLTPIGAWLFSLPYQPPKASSVDKIS